MPIPSSRLSLSVCVVLSVVLPGAVGSAHSAVDDVPLIEAVKEGNAAVVRAVLAGQVDVDGSEPDGTTALHWAAHLGDAASVELLLDAGADLRATTRNGTTP